jgi:hypothetical protein
MLYNREPRKLTRPSTGGKGVAMNGLAPFTGSENFSKVKTYGYYPQQKKRVSIKTYP